LKNYYVKLQFF